MKVIFLYRPDSEDARRVEEYIHDFTHDHPGSPVETHNIDSVEGTDLAKLYGIMVFPAIIALNNDGRMQQMWEGVDRLPLMNDLAYFATQ